MPNYYQMLIKGNDEERKRAADKLSLYYSPYDKSHEDQIKRIVKLFEKNVDKEKNEDVLYWYGNAFKHYHYLVNIKTINKIASILTEKKNCQISPNFSRCFKSDSRLSSNSS